jgi:Mg-chelatase subunit ChlD
MRSKKIATVGLLVLFILSLGMFHAAEVGAQTSGARTILTVLVLDTSGSMNDQDASGTVKLDAAKAAAKNLLRMMASQNDAGLSTVNQAGIVEFYDSANVAMRPTTDMNAAINALDSLYATGGTGMPKGLRMALDLFPTNPTDVSIIILLSDGLPNIGLNDEQDEAVVRAQVLDQATEAGRRGICLYTIGLGDPAAGTIDEGFLQQVASNSGCGKYYNARNAGDLAKIYLELGHGSTGQILLNKSGRIRQNETVIIDNVQVPDNQETMLFSLNWPGSQLEAELRDPNGVVVNSQTYPTGVYITTTETLISIIVQNPHPGLWSVSARGVNVPGGTTTYNAILSVRPSPYSPTPAIPTSTPFISTSSGGGSFGIVLVVLAAVGVMVYIMTQAQRRTTRHQPILPGTSAVLFGLNGPYVGRSLPLTDGFLIGRSSSCQLRLFEDIISRQHARMRYSSGRWYIQDLNSQSGVFINGARVQATVLNRGDRVRIGSTEFEFR